MSTIPGKGTADRMSYEIIQAICDSREEMALVTVIDVRGSVPRHAGSKMLVQPRGGLSRNRGGRKRRGARHRHGPGMHRAEKGGHPHPRVPGRGGRGAGHDLRRHLPDPRGIPRGPRAVPHRLQPAAAGRADPLCQDDRRRVRGRRAAVTVAVLDENGAPLYGSLPSSARGGGGEGPFTAAPPLSSKRKGFSSILSFRKRSSSSSGGGYVGQAVAFQASRLDFKITVADDREEFSAAGRFPPAVETLCGSYTEIVRRFPFDSATYVVMVTRGHLTDLECVRAVLARKYRYAGFIGSERKAKLLREQLKKRRLRAGEDRRPARAHRAGHQGGDTRGAGHRDPRRDRRRQAARRPGAGGPRRPAPRALPRPSEVDLGKEVIPRHALFSQDGEHLVDHVAVAAEVAQAGGIDGIVPQPAA